MSAVRPGTPATAAPVDRDARVRRALALLMTASAVVAVVTAGYLALVELSGNIPVCGPVKGCEDVANSAYSRVLGIPIALPGLGMALVILATVLAWWRTGDRRTLYAAYGLGLLGVFVVAYLTYLELFVIHAVCIWCVTFAVSVVLGWILSLVALRRASSG